MKLRSDSWSDGEPIPELPIDPAVVEQIKAIDWDSAAHDWEW